MLTKVHLNNVNNADAYNLVSFNTEKKAALTPKQISKKAQATTVKVLSGKTWGSGILVDKKNSIYTVVTNRHVLVFSKDKTYQIQTPDGKVYPGNILEAVDFEDHDLALLQFSSNQKYGIVTISSIALNSLDKEKVFSVGFPVETEGEEKIKGFHFTNGHIAKFTPLDFGGGYQIGYTNDVQKGMSGGALINTKGEVVGINGVHKYPLWGNPYQFSDGSLASKKQQEEMSKFSWAIPINTFLKLAPQFSGSNN